MNLHFAQKFLIYHKALILINNCECLIYHLLNNKCYLNKSDLNFDELTKKQKQNMIKTLTAQMQEAAKKLDFEEAANLRDAIMDLKKQVHEKKK